MIHCEIVEEKVCSTSVYGLTFSDKDSGEVLCTFPDVFDDRARAIAFRDTVNVSDVCREHIQDIVEDALI